MKEYIIFERNHNREFKSEISTMLGILLIVKMEGVEKRVKMEAPLNTLEKVQTKIIFDFIDFLI